MYILYYIMRRLVCAVLFVYVRYKYGSGSYGISFICARLQTSRQMSRLYEMWHSVIQSRILHVASSRWQVDVCMCTYANETSQTDYVSNTISIIIPSPNSNGPNAVTQAITSCNFQQFKDSEILKGH